MAWIITVCPSPKTHVRGLATSFMLMGRQWKLKRWGLVGGLCHHREHRRVFSFSFVLPGYRVSSFCSTPHSHYGVPHPIPSPPAASSLKTIGPSDHGGNFQTCGTKTLFIIISKQQKANTKELRQIHSYEILMLSECIFYIAGWFETWFGPKDCSHSDACACLQWVGGDVFCKLKFRSDDLNRGHSHVLVWKLRTLTHSTNFIEPKRQFSIITEWVCHFVWQTLSITNCICLNFPTYWTVSL